MQQADACIQIGGWQKCSRPKGDRQAFKKHTGSRKKAQERNVAGVTLPQTPSKRFHDSKALEKIGKILKKFLTMAQFVYPTVCFNNAATCKWSQGKFQIWHKHQDTGTYGRLSGRNKQKAVTYGGLVHRSRTAGKHIDGRQTHR
jgi:hypothetical protein